MRRTTVNRVLVIYITVLWAAVVTRCDYFPLTWVPMYSSLKSTPTVCIRVKDDERMNKGLLVTHRDGSTSELSRHDLNIPKWNFYRLYYKRMFSQGPPLHVVRDDWGKNRNMSEFNMWLRGNERSDFTGEGWGEARWEWAVFRSLNRTLAHQPDDPGFIVRIEIEYQESCYLREDPAQSEQVVKRAVWEWNDAFLERWQDEVL